MTLLLVLLFSVQLSGWELLASVEVVQGYDEFMGGEIEKPRFSSQLMAKEGEELTLEGYIIPLDETANEYFILSRFPYQSCFFCGAAGPETVIEIYSEHKVSYTDERVKVTGKLKLNADNPLHLFYILEDCNVQKLD